MQWLSVLCMAPSRGPVKDTARAPPWLPFGVLICVCACVGVWCTCARVCMYVEAGDQCLCLPQLFSILVFEKGPFILPKAH